ncbi:hypothetical protein [Paraburkholderia dinghuensis]|uniref:Uncharacterized protein n=1 Tax=Paraburkholderia dinghuensis TaxID=2305225 RepID=A0A3N6MP30_9BURK|nr:hypothetical protein [Paraburkholderia dinghuensis]RQH05348.1 hypothetical protein D1Y85_14890 [Paraburkholderia dinghuensis]
MREQLAGDIVWLGGGVLYAWLTCALAQLAALAPAWARRAAVPARVKPGCVRCMSPWREYRVASAICYGLLLTVPPGVLAASVAHAADAAVAVVVGVFAGVWPGILLDVRARVRTTAVAGCVGGLAALGGGFAWFLVRPEPGLLEQRVALYLAVALGALLLGAAATALCGAVHVGPRQPFTASERVVHFVALLLGIALGCGFATASVGHESGLSMLVSASVLGAALGMRVMSGAQSRGTVRFALARHASGGWPVTGAGVLRPGFAGVPDDLLVEACGSGSFAPECLYARVAPNEGAIHAVHHVSRDLPRRRRSRHRALRHRQGPH